MSLFDRVILMQTYPEVLYGLNYNLLSQFEIFSTNPKNLKEGCSSN
jgi:hypothetical protein